jgi:hypothetical protein
VSANLNSSHDTITLGNGAGDAVSAEGPGPFGNANIITLGAGADDTVNADGSSFDTITLGKGAGDTVSVKSSSFDTITLGNGGHDVVSAQNSLGDSITVGSGDDTIYAGQNTTIKVGTGHDSFVFEQTKPGTVGQAVITGFDPQKDVITFSSQLTTSVSHQDDAHGNAVITVDNAGDTITLMGVHASQLHPSDFHFVDPAAVPASATTAQMIADLHAHNIL